jgi:hypothetical protein
MDRVETCPRCGESSAVHPKLVLIDAAWVPVPGKDAGYEYFTSLRVDAVQPQYLREHPLEQFLDGFFCDRCKKGFVSEKGLQENRKRYWL